MADKEDKKDFAEGAGGWKKFIFNPGTGQFMGRTASSWALIFLFYLVFYGFLAGLFSFTMWVMLQMLDDYTPKYRDRVSSPGLMIRPKVGSSLEIVFNKSDAKSYEKYVTALDGFLKPYDDLIQAQKNILCHPGDYLRQPPNILIKKACQFNRTMLGDCSGANNSSFGYNEGKPCVLVKMNRIIGLEAGAGNNPIINCTTKKEPQVDAKYFGSFDKMYYPYYGKKAHVNYSQPLVAVKLMLGTNDTNKDLMIECKITGTNLKNDDDRDRFLGRVAFRVHVTE
ncbi:sodium/potassium-transporting ATPase subunit beta-3a isoform X1 [Scyliorhinus canicula]|uniref:sodium/potassium-transporting ATPase subunit beta-3a isoform X1 n=1 Tax=Scyliorhinus canicula TaxID=7830 RepID=UPI0018F733F7|nr:sodium/potassium-transporting ATPase subunit beta-3a isoform X1 [Scyliorhinus canicula]